jgi:hypothetical protein
VTTASKDAKLIAVAVAMGFGAVVFTLFEIFAPETGIVAVLAISMLPTGIVTIADLLGFADSPSLSRSEEVPE